VTLEIPTRRGLLKGLIAFTAAAPAIVKAASIMPVSSKALVTPPMMRFDGELWWDASSTEGKLYVWAQGAWRQMGDQYPWISDQGGFGKVRRSDLTLDGVPIYFDGPVSDLI